MERSRFDENVPAWELLVTSVDIYSIKFPTRRIGIKRSLEGLGWTGVGPDRRIPHIPVTARTPRRSGPGRGVTAAGHRDFERERERADRLMTELLRATPCSQGKRRPGSTAPRCHGGGGVARWEATYSDGSKLSLYHLASWLVATAVALTNRAARDGGSSRLARS